MKILIFYSTAGEGHKKIAEAIQKELKTRPNISEVEGWDAFDKVGKLFRESYPVVYYYAVKYAPKFWGILYEGTDTPAVASLIRPGRSVWNRFQSKSLRQFVIREKPDVIISTHFFAAEVFATAKRKGEIKSKILTVVTDVMPHTFWINEGTDRYWVMAEESRDALVKRGIPFDRVSVGGIPVDSAFCGQENREVLLDRFGMSPKRFNILFSSGSFGIGPTERWLEELRPYGNQIQVAVVCGRNRQLYEHLSENRYPFPIFLLGFVPNMHELMSVSDLLIAKPGGATTCESLAKGLPMLISAPIPGQETRNAEWLVKQGASIEVRTVQEFQIAIQKCVENQEFLHELKTAVGSIAKPNAARDLADFIESWT